MASNYQLSHLSLGRKSNPASEVGGESVTTLPPWFPETVVGLAYDLRGTLLANKGYMICRTYRICLIVKSCLPLLGIMSKKKSKKYTAMTDKNAASGNSSSNDQEMAISQKVDIYVVANMGNQIKE